MVNDYKSVHSQGVSQPSLDVSNQLEILIIVRTTIISLGTNL